MTDQAALRPFLDANILFSAAYLDWSGMNRLWRLEGVQLVTSPYAVQEATTNLPTRRHKAALQGLLTTVELVADPPPTPLFREAYGLPEKDRPILWAAIDAQCTHLITGDRAHFGPLMDSDVEGATVVLAATFFDIHRARCATFEPPPGG